MNSHDATFFDHLEELRRRILFILLWFFLCCIIVYVFNNQILKFVIRPLSIFQKNPVFVSPVEPFFSVIKLTLFFGFLLSCPFVFFQIYVFVKPALSNEQAKLFLFSLSAGLLLFYVGILLGYYFIVPVGLKILLAFGENLMVPLVTIGYYLSFFIWIVLALGIVFQMPVVLAFFGISGIISIDQMKKLRKFVYVGAFIISAIITPTTDAITQTIIAGVLIFLYEITLIFLGFFLKHKILEDKKL
ncbi:MAG TPA: twin-arginine translocase subunit TatC [bacterium]|nr:twin-arginine translocase subunit TatC [bacterium]HOL34361.1 twin-arginine translocase subunit TatC [bacterium]HPP07498.1 twin-arginine translocase subunit TatC [bacterium]